jgi:hypothetical protein
MRLCRKSSAYWQVNPLFVPVVFGGRDGMMMVPLPYEDRQLVSRSGAEGRNLCALIILLFIHADILTRNWDWGRTIFQVPSSLVAAAASDMKKVMEV